MLNKPNNEYVSRCAKQLVLEEISYAHFDAQFIFLKDKGCKGVEGTSGIILKVLVVFGSCNTFMDGVLSVDISGITCNVH